MNKDVEQKEENKNKRLFRLSMRGEWGEVVKIYKSSGKEAQNPRITKSGDTALHVAITDGRDDVVKELVDLICREALRIQNERGNTVLHFAASMGSVQTCECIAKANASLLSVRNVDGETPLFLAALHGRKEAFMSLHRHTDPKGPNYYSDCRRNDGDTILHSAIAGDYFDLAFQIIHLYGDLVNMVNECGFSPLHLLAGKPSAFKSGTYLGCFETIFYHGIFVKELEVAQPLRPSTEKKSIVYPENYQTCMNILSVIKHSACVVTNKFPVTRYLIRKFIRKDQPRNHDPEEAAIQETKTKPSESAETRHWSNPLFPANYKSCVDFFKFVFMVMLVIFGRESTTIRKIRRKKEKHVRSAQIMNELLERPSMYGYEYDDRGSNPPPYLDYNTEGTAPYSFEEERGDATLASVVKDQQPSRTTGSVTHQQRNKADESVKIEKVKLVETPLLIAAKNGVTEMVEKILEIFPVAVHDMDAKNKNIVLLAVESRQPQLYELLQRKKVLKSLFQKVDKEGNSALHLAARLVDYNRAHGPVLHMHYEMKWYFYVRSWMPNHFCSLRNKEYKTPSDIFTETHKYLVISCGKWLKFTSESCSFVAALIATVVFSTSTTVPGDFKDESGTPTLEGQPGFKAFSISSLIALCSSVTSLVLFLSILTSHQYQERDYVKHIPRKLILSLTMLFISIIAMMVCFCAGHFFVLKEKVGLVAVPIYVATCLPVTLVVLAQFPLYFDLIRATFRALPPRSYKDTLL